MQKKVEYPFTLVPKLGFFDHNEQQIELSRPPQWEIIGMLSLLKIKAKSREQMLFAKAYAPIIAHVAAKVATVLYQLSELQLTVPVLAPIIVQEGVHYFSLGTNSRITHADAIYTTAEIDAIAQIIEVIGLEPAFSNKFNPVFNRAETVSIGGQTYLIDPINDSFLEDYIRLVAK